MNLISASKRKADAIWRIDPIDHFLLIPSRFKKVRPIFNQKNLGEKYNKAVTKIVSAKSDHLANKKEFMVWFQTGSIGTSNGSTISMSTINAAIENILQNNRKIAGLQKEIKSIKKSDPKGQNAAKTRARKEKIKRASVEQLSLLKSVIVLLATVAEELVV